MDWKEDEYENLLRQFQPRKPSVPKEMAPVRVRPIGLWLTGAAAVLLIIISFAVVRTVSRMGAPAVVETADVSLYRVTGDKTEVVHTGQTIQTGEVVRANGGSGGVVALTDGSRVELRSHSEFLLEHAADGIRIRLVNGSIIVNAAKQATGRHLYVQTRDVVVSVVGTVFLVNAEEEGSRVAVIQGEVRVQQGETSQKLTPGELVTSNPSVEPPPMREEISWSRNVQTHLAMLQQSAVKLAAIAAQKEPETHDAFEVASVKLSDPSQNGPALQPGWFACRGMIQVDPTRFVGRRLTLYRLVALGYGKNCPSFPSTEPDHITGAPSWLKSDAFDIQGVIPAGSPTYTQRQLTDGKAPKLQSMIRTLLAERFNLVLHREMREMPVFNLVVVKEGKLKANEEPSEGAAVSQSGPPRGQIGFGVDPPNGKVFIAGTAISMWDLVNLFQGHVGRFIVDKTGLTRLYDIPPMTIDVGPFDISPNAVSVWPSIAAEALPQLGLKLEPARGPVEVLVIDRAEKPTEN